MPTTTDLLIPINTAEGLAFNTTAILSSINSGLVYDVSRYSMIRAQIDSPLDSVAKGTVSVQGSNDGATW